MSGILDKKQRLIDFNLTSNGYKQIANGDLRLIYATLTDKNAIYDIKQNEYNIADLDAMSFFFETNNSFYDNINIELDLTRTANFSLKSNVNGEIVDLNNNQIISSLNLNTTEIFSNIATNISNNLFQQQIVLTDNQFELDNDISLYISKINDLNYIPSDEININSFSPTIRINNISNYNTLVDRNSTNIDLSRTSLLEDDRFQYKLNYLFLPPDNLNRDVTTFNDKIMNTYNLTTDKRIPHKIILKNFSLNAEDAERLVRNLFHVNDNQVINGNMYVDLLWNDFKKSPVLFDNDNKSEYLPLNYDDLLKGALDILENENIAKNISKIELSFEKFEENVDFILNLSELFIDADNNTSKFNKLLFLNHGEIFTTTKQKNIQIYSVGKLFDSKYEVDIDNFNFQQDNSRYIMEDNYLFVNLFTIILE